MNAWPEGSRRPEYPAIDDASLLKVETEESGFDRFDDSLAEKYPLLARALQDKVKAFNTKIEWTRDIIRAPGQDHQIIVEYNWCQIHRVLRRDIDGTEEAAAAASFDELCGDIEAVLWDGKRSPVVQYGVPQKHTLARWCGGVRELLGRDPNSADIIKLRPIREPVWRVTRYPKERGGQVLGEWITEYSLQAIPQYE